VLDSSLQQSIHSLQPHARSDRIEGPNSWDLGQPLPLLKYVPTFSQNVPEDILQCLGDTMRPKSGSFWAIPSDGLVELALSAIVLGIKFSRPASEREAFIGSELRKEIERKLDSLCVFDKTLSEMPGCGFLYSILIPSPEEGYVTSLVKVRALTYLMIRLRGTSNGKTKILVQSGTQTQPPFSCP